MNRRKLADSYEQLFQVMTQLHLPYVRTDVPADSMNL